MKNNLEKLECAFSNPSGWDSRENYMGQTKFPGLYVVMVKTRDSDILTESNWKTALERLKPFENDGEEGGFQTVRFGHWACGWIEYLCVSDDSPGAIAEGNAIAEAIESYPVLDEEEFSQMEDEEVCRVWNDCYNLRERVDLCRKYGESIFAARREYPPYGGMLYDHLRAA
jgi:hypothetical protein